MNRLVHGLCFLLAPWFCILEARVHSGKGRPLYFSEENLPNLAAAGYFNSSKKGGTANKDSPVMPATVSTSGSSGSGFAWGPAIGGLTVIGLVVGFAVAASVNSGSSFSKHAASAPPPPPI